MNSTSNCTGPAAPHGRAYLFAEADGNDLTYFIKYKLQVLRQAYADLQAHLARQQQQTAQTRQLLLAGLNERQRQVLQPALENPDLLLTILEVQHRFGVVYQTARTDLMRLAEPGLPEARRIGKAKLAYVRAADFEAVLARLRG